MGLEQFRRQRMVILHPKSTAYDAARAMVDNHVGALLISEEHVLTGMITDRDLVSEVIASGLDPTLVALGDIMSDVVVAIDITGDVATAAAMMAKHACRRLPVLEKGKAVGFVTLDDLLLDGAIDTRAAAEIVRSQLEAPTRYTRSGAVSPDVPARPEASLRGGRAMTRRNARASSSYVRLLKLVEQRAHLEDRSRAELALKIVLGSICRRLTPEEARHLIAQLPSVIKDALSAHLDGPNRQITRAGIEQEISAVLAIDLSRATEVASGVAQAIADSISEGLLIAMRGQLPKEMKELFPQWNVHHHTVAE